MQEQEQEFKENRIKELLDKYASFIHQKSDEKIKIIRLCGILAYLEEIKKRNMTINEAIVRLENFLNKLIKPYTGGDFNG